MIYAHSLDPDQAWQNVRPGLDPNYLTLWWYSWKIFLKSLILKKISRRQTFLKKFPACKELNPGFIFCQTFIILFNLIGLLDHSDDPLNFMSVCLFLNETFLVGTLRWEQFFFFFFVFASSYFCWKQKLFSFFDYCIPSNQLIICMSSKIACFFCIFNDRDNDWLDLNWNKVTRIVLESSWK